MVDEDKTVADTQSGDGEQPEPREWTEADTKRLVESYGEKDHAYLARELGITVEELRQRAWDAFDGELETGEWTEGDRRTLRRYIGAVEGAMLARMLRRTEASVQSEVVRLASTLTDDDLTSEEVVRFKRLFGTRTNEDLALVFGRTTGVIERVSKRLCLQKDKAFLKRRVKDVPDASKARTRMPRWTADELALLKELYPSTSNLEIASRLTRSVKSVVSKAHNMGLKKNEAHLRQMGQKNVSSRYRNDEK